MGKGVGGLRRDERVGSRERGVEAAEMNLRDGGKNRGEGLAD